MMNHMWRRFFPMIAFATHLLADPAHSHLRPAEYLSTQLAIPHPNLSPESTFESGIENEMARKCFDQAVDLLHRGDTTTARHLLRTAAAADPFNPLPDLMLCLACVESHPYVAGTHAESAWKKALNFRDLPVWQRRWVKTIRDTFPNQFSTPVRLQKLSDFFSTEANLDDAPVQALLFAARFALLQNTANPAPPLILQSLEKVAQKKPETPVEYYLQLAGISIALPKNPTPAQIRAHAQKLMTDGRSEEAFPLLLQAWEKQAAQLVSLGLPPTVDPSLNAHLLALADALSMDEQHTNFSRLITAGKKLPRYPDNLLSTTLWKAEARHLLRYQKYEALAAMLETQEARTLSKDTQKIWREIIHVHANKTQPPVTTVPVLKPYAAALDGIVSELVTLTPEIDHSHIAIALHNSSRGAPTAETIQSLFSPAQKKLSLALCLSGKSKNSAPALLLDSQLWTPPLEPTWSALDASSTRRTSDEFSGKPRLIFFYFGADCIFCVSQFQKILPHSQTLRNLQLIAIGPDAPEKLGTTATQVSANPGKFPFLVLSDTAHNAFRAFGAYNEFKNTPLHGIFLVDEENRILWSQTSLHAFENIDFLVAEIMRQLSEKPSNPD